MASDASPRADDPKMMESPASMAHASSEDGYFKRPNTMSIDGDIRLDSGWFSVGFEVGGRLARN